MATISFTNSLNYTRAFTETELISILTNLNGSSNYFANGLNELVYIRIASGSLLLVDLNSHINRQLFEIYSFHFSVTNQFNLKLVHNDNALELNINDALLSVGYSGTIPISTLESVFMKMYTNSNQAYLLSHDIVKHTGNFGVEPAELKSLVAGSGIVLSNDANNLTITANITSLSNVYTQTEVDNLLNTKQDLIALLNDNTKIQLLNNSNVLKSISAGNNIVLTNDATSDQFLEISADLSSYYTQAEVNNLLGFKQNVMALLNDNTKIQLLNNNNVLKSLSAGNNIVLANDDAYDRFVDISVDLSSYYTQTEVSNLLNTKQDVIALLNDNTKVQLLNNSNVLKSLSAGNNMVLTNDVANNQFVELAVDLSSYYTQTEVSNLLSAINQAVSAPSVTGISLLNSDGKIRTIDTELPLMTTLNETIDPNGSVTESRITFKMQQQTSFNFGNSLFDSVTGTMRLAVAPTANDTPTVDNTKMSITPNGDVGVGTTTPQSKLHVVGDVRVDGSITGAFNSNVSAPSATGTSLLSSDGKLRTLDTQLPLLMTVNETTDNGIVTESNLTLKINTSDLGPTWTTFTSVSNYDIVLSGQPLEEFRVHLEKDTDVSYAKLLLHAIKDNGTPDVMSYNQWRFSEIPWGFNGVTDSFSMNMPYICDKSQPDVIDPVDLTISVSRGSQRNHITCQANWRNISTTGLIRTWASGYFDTTNLHLLRIVFENSVAFSGQIMKVI